MKMIFVVCVYVADGKRRAFAETIKTGQNLKSIQGLCNADCIHLCESRKQADDIARAWNDSYRRNGTLL